MTAAWHNTATALALVAAGVGRPRFVLAEVRRHGGLNPDQPGPLDYLTEAQRKQHMFRVKQFNFKYANQHLYTDIEPWEVVNVISAKTIEIRKMKAVEADWGREFVAGGFFGHTPNNQDQKWLIGSDETQPVIRARLNKKGFYKSDYGRHFLADQPIKFYDYNF